MKEAKLVIMVDDLDFGIRDVVFEAKVFNRYGTLIWLNCKEEYGRSKLCIFALWFVRHGNFDHNHFEGEITSYTDAWITFVERHVCEGEFF